MTRTARVWITGGREHDEEFCFQNSTDVLQQLNEIRARRQIRHCKLQVHDLLQATRYPRVIHDDVELDMLPRNGAGEEGMPSMSPTL